MVPGDARYGNHAKEGVVRRLSGSPVKLHKMRPRPTGARSKPARAQPVSKQSNPHTARRDLRRATPALLVASISLFLIFSGASKRLVIRQSGSVKGAALAHTLTVSAG